MLAFVLEDMASLCGAEVCGLTRDSSLPWGGQGGHGSGLVGRCMLCW